MKKIIIVSFVILITFLLFTLFVNQYYEKSQYTTTTLIDAVSVDHPKELTVLEPLNDENRIELINMLNNWDWRFTSLIYTTQSIDEEISYSKSVGIEDVLFDEVNQNNHRAVVLADQSIIVVLATQNDILIDGELNNFTLSFEIKCSDEEIEVSSSNVIFLTCSEARAAAIKMASSIAVFDKKSLQSHMQQHADNWRLEVEEMRRQTQEAYDNRNSQ